MSRLTALQCRCLLRQHKLGPVQLLMWATLWAAACCGEACMSSSSTVGPSAADHVGNTLGSRVGGRGLCVQHSCC